MIDEGEALPSELLSRSSLRGRERAWPISDIPAVIEAAREAGLLSLGGQLQFRFENTTCECYWVDIDPADKVSGPLPWRERVARTAEIAVTDWQSLQERYDFMAVGRAHFPEPFERCIASGHDPAEAMCFVWYLKTEIGWASLEKRGTIVITGGR